MSERTFLRRFQSEAGINPKAWLLQERVRCAQRLLEETDAPLDAVCADSGFASAETFRAAFRKLTGVAPMDTDATSRRELAPLTGRRLGLRLSLISVSR
jgi:AraC family transcriptional activator FtrA